MAWLLDDGVQVVWAHMGSNMCDTARMQPRQSRYCLCASAGSESEDWIMNISVGRRGFSWQGSDTSEDLQKWPKKLNPVLTVDIVRLRARLGGQRDGPKRR